MMLSANTAAKLLRISWRDCSGLGNTVRVVVEGGVYSNELELA